MRIRITCEPALPDCDVPNPEPEQGIKFIPLLRQVGGSGRNVETQIFRRIAWAKVNEEDYERLSQVKWSARWDAHTNSYYATRSYKTTERKTINVQMAREVVGLPETTIEDKRVADHINRDTLDNTRTNLRIVTEQENRTNKIYGEKNRKWRTVEVENKFREEGEIVFISLTNGGEALIDREDWDLVREYTWYKWKDPKKDTWYAVTNALMPTGKKGLLYLHKHVMKIPYGDARMVDHKETGNGLDCRKSNLRIATVSENNRNIGLRSNSKSGYKSVRQLVNGRWQARISKDGNQRSVGCFESKEEAAFAYNVAAGIWFKDFAWLNSLDGSGLSEGRKTNIRREVETKFQT